jgi:hypothetical protein
MTIDRGSYYKMRGDTVIRVDEINFDNASCDCSIFLDGKFEKKEILYFEIFEYAQLISDLNFKLDVILND